MTPQPALLDILTASMLSATVPDLVHLLTVTQRSSHGYSDTEVCLATVTHTAGIHLLTVTQRAWSHGAWIHREELSSEYMSVGCTGPLSHLEQEGVAGLDVNALGHSLHSAAGAQNRSRHCQSLPLPPLSQ